MNAGEEYAAQRLCEFLRGRRSDCTYVPGDDPPDYVFEVNGARWAVEVTELHDYVDAGRPQSSLGLVAGLKKILDDIDRETAASRKSEYTIVLKGPISPQEVPEIKRQAINHIRENNRERLACGENEECEIFSEGGPGPRLNLIPFVDGRARLPRSTNIHANIQATVDDAVSRILARKVPNLRHLCEFDKRVLCVLFQYPFADDGNVRSAFSQHEDQLRDLDIVFLISGNSVVDLSP